MFKSEATTRDVQVQVASAFMPERSKPESNYFFFVYRIRITNLGEETVQLMSRHWIIADAENKVQEVKGPGVIGEQPRLEAGESFQYTSFCPLPTPVGSMRGTFQMVQEDGEMFDAEVAVFTLADPSVLN